MWHWYCIRGGSLSQGSRALSERTERQASNLAQITASVQAKMSFVQQLDDVIVGCGVYKNPIAT
jgi:hypothetical protein